MPRFPEQQPMKPETPTKDTTDEATSPPKSDKEPAVKPTPKDTKKNSDKADKEEPAVGGPKAR